MIQESLSLTMSQVCSQIEGSFPQQQNSLTSTVVSFSLTPVALNIEQLRPLIFRIHISKALHIHPYVCQEDRILSKGGE